MKAISLTNGSDIFSIAQDQVSNLEGWEYASVRDVVEDIAGIQSAVYLTSKQGRRRFSMTVYIPDQCLDDKRDMLKVLRQSGNMKLLKFTTIDDLLLQAYVEILAVKYPYNTLRKPFLIEMVAPDWRFYSQTENTESVAVSASETVTNDGTDVSQPVFRVHGPLATATIQNLTTAEQIDLTYALGDGSYIDIDCLNRTVKLNGVTSVFSAFDGDFPRLLPGDNSISLLATGSGGNTSLDVIYRDAYNGV